MRKVVRLAWVLPNYREQGLIRDKVKDVAPVSPAELKTPALQGGHDSLGPCPKQSHPDCTCYSIFDQVAESTEVFSQGRLLCAKLNRCCMLLSELKKITWSLLCPSVRCFILSRHPPCPLLTTMIVTRKSTCSTVMCLNSAH